MSEEQIGEMVKEFRKYIVELLPEMDKHSTLYLMQAFEDKYAGFRKGYEIALTKK